ncbi:MAG: hypothetical protein AAF608_14665 [Pseudomonadota bacterium]
MAISKRIASLVVAAILAFGGMALAHRMPEVYVTLETSDLEGEPITAVTIRLHAEDAIALLAAFDEPVSNLDTRAEHEALARLTTEGLVTTGGSLTLLGGEIDGHAVLLYLTGAPGFAVTESAILSAIYPQWTNRVSDLTGETPQGAVFTQGGEHTHHH